MSSEEDDGVVRGTREYCNTVDRLEPNIAPVHASRAYTSRAVSAKRQADALERQADALERLADFSVFVRAMMLVFSAGAIVGIILAIVHP